MGDDLRNESEERRRHECDEAIHDALGVLSKFMPGHIVYTPEALVTMRDYERKLENELRTLREDKEALDWIDQSCSRFMDLFFPWDDPNFRYDIRNIIRHQRKREAAANEKTEGEDPPLNRE